ncbi:hypothetical protein J2X05_003530 [Cellvibrio fibrivorans]|jgi:hypothetical protein|uniref:Uncharacterized protein n=1 Tax=Cellvibrio fibrivorans TaxID=126350 RepID=A0ABU1V253_9GAMM|nr:hypothetical protein [Cellvibrio fibrivorans]
MLVIFFMLHPQHFMTAPDHPLKSAVLFDMTNAEFSLLFYVLLPHING